MKTRFHHIHAVLLFVLLLGAESCQRPTIPMRTMKRIYSDMFIADANLDFKPDLFLKVDTMAVYPPIFEKYGYTTEQFIEAQEYYISHPDKMIKIAEQLKAEYDAKGAVAERALAVQDSLADIEYQKQQAIQTAIDNFLDSISFACLLDTIVVCYGDSSSVAKAAADTTVKAASDTTVKAASDTSAKPLVKAVADTAAKPAAKSDSLKRRIPSRKLIKSDNR